MEAAAGPSEMSQRIREQPRHSWWRGLLFALVLAAVTISASRPAWHGGFLWDDDVYITNNELLTAPDGLRRIWFSLDSPSQYFPLVYTTFRIEHALWGITPTGYHWVNLLLHIGNALLVWLVLTRLNVPGAWLTGAIFALHPVQVESVAWITERKNVLMGFFFLLTLLAWIAFTDESTRRPWRFFVLAEEAHRQATANTDPSIPNLGIQHGISGSLVGTIPPGYARPAFPIECS